MEFHSKSIEEGLKVIIIQSFHDFILIFTTENRQIELKNPMLSLPPGHCGEFSRHRCDDELAQSENLSVDDVRVPAVRTEDLSEVNCSFRI